MKCWEREGGYVGYSLQIKSYMLKFNCNFVEPLLNFKNGNFFDFKNLLCRETDFVLKNENTESALHIYTKYLLISLFSLKIYLCVLSVFHFNIIYVVSLKKYLIINICILPHVLIYRWFEWINWIKLNWNRYTAKLTYITMHYAYLVWDLYEPILIFAILQTHPLTHHKTN